MNHGCPPDSKSIGYPKSTSFHAKLFPYILTVVVLMVVVPIVFQVAKRIYLKRMYAQYERI